MKIQIVSPDFYSDHMTLWHDYWVRMSTKKAAERLGHDVVSPDYNQADVDLQLVFWGHKPKVIPAVGKFRAVWFQSRIDKVTPTEELVEYDQIYSLTSVHQKVLAQRGIKSKVLLIATDKEYKPAGQYQYDIAYMGSAIWPQRRAMLKNIADAGFKIVVAGYKWAEQKSIVTHPNITVVAEFWPNDQFSDFYNLAPVSVYPSPQAYVQNGLVPIRVQDIYASSDCLCIVEKNSALKEVFKPVPPQYNDAKQLDDLIRFYLRHDTDRQQLQRDIRTGITRRYEDFVQDVINDAKGLIQ